MEIRKLKIKDIVPNKYNSNKMNESQLNHLIAEFKRIGYLSPILVRPKGDRFEVVGGAHRLRAAGIAGMTEIECVVKEMTDDEAKVTGINLNRVHGEDDPEKLAELLKELKGSFDISELSGLINMSEKELESFDLILDLPDAEELDEKPEPEKFRYSFNLTSEQDNSFIKALRYTKIQNNLTAAFMSIVEDYIYYIEHKDAKV